MASFHSARLPIAIKKTLSEILNRDFHFDGALVTLTEVVLNKNLDRAEIGISIFPSVKSTPVLKELHHRQGEFQHQLIKKLNLRFVPRIEFVLDEGPANAARVDKLLDSE